MIRCKNTSLYSEIPMVVDDFIYLSSNLRLEQNMWSASLLPNVSLGKGAATS